jgi:galactokinase/mevalonate kinase-like predicted kinase
MKITKKAISEFTKREMNLKKIGKLMNLYWEEKKKLTKGVTNQAY